MYALNDTFNGVEISKHRSLAAAAKAQAKHERAVRRANGDNSNLTYAVTVDGEALSEADYDRYMDLLIGEKNQ